MRLKELYGGGMTKKIEKRNEPHFLTFVREQFSFLLWYYKTESSDFIASVLSVFPFQNLRSQ